MSSERVFRVTVRGRFGELSDTARRYLQAHAHEHDIFLSAYTAEGTLTYDSHIAFFNLRYEIRGEGGADDAGASGLVEAEGFLSTMGFTHRGLKATVVDVAAIWDAPPNSRLDQDLGRRG